MPKERNIVEKFRRYALKATFPSAFIRKCLSTDSEKDCYANGLTTGTHIDGEIISLEAIGKYAPWAVDEFRKALQERRKYHSGRFDFEDMTARCGLRLPIKMTTIIAKAMSKPGSAKNTMAVATAITTR